MISGKITDVYIETSVTKKTNLPMMARLVVLSSADLDAEENKKIIEECGKLGIRLEWAGNPEREGENCKKKFSISEIPEEFLREFSSSEIKEILREYNLIPGKFQTGEQERLLEKITKIF